MLLDVRFCIDHCLMIAVGVCCSVLVVVVCCLLVFVVRRCVLFVGCCCHWFLLTAVA